MRVDGHLFQFQFEKGYLKVLATTPAQAHLNHDNDTSKGMKVVTRVENPLQQHIIALLKGQPLVDIGQTVRSQQFLDSVAAFSGA